MLFRLFAALFFISISPDLRADDLDDANVAGQRGDYATALRLLTPLADAGGAQAQFYLGHMYANGLGVEQDYLRAAGLYRQSADQGNSQSAVFLGQLYETGKGVPIDYGQAAQLYQRAALRGDVEGQIQLSGLYRVGRGVKQDLLMAHMWAIVAVDNANGEMIERALSNKNQFSRQLTAGQMIAAQEMAEICEETNLKTCDRVVVKATNPWPPIAILDRAADAECKIRDVLVRGENKAAERARAAADEKQKSIDNDAADANAAQDKRKAGNNFNIETGMKRTGFSLDLPEVTVSYSSTTVPTVHVTFGRTTINLITIGQCSVGSADIPEFDGLSITMKTHTIYVPCPTTKRVVLSMPQFTLGQTTINLPQITTRMVRKDVSFHVPQFTYRDYEKVESDAEDKLQAERDLLKRALDEIKGELSLNLGDGRVRRQRLELSA